MVGSIHFAAKAQHSPAKQQKAPWAPAKPKDLNKETDGIVAASREDKHRIGEQRPKQLASRKSDLSVPTRKELKHIQHQKEMEQVQKNIEQIQKEIDSNTKSFKAVDTEQSPPVKTQSDTVTCREGYTTEEKKAAIKCQTQNEISKKFIEEGKNAINKSFQKGYDGIETSKPPAAPKPDLNKETDGIIAASREAKANKHQSLTEQALRSTALSANSAQQKIEKLQADIKHFTFETHQQELVENALNMFINLNSKSKPKPEDLPAKDQHGNPIPR